MKTNAFRSQQSFRSLKNRNIDKKTFNYDENTSKAQMNGRYEVFRTARETQIGLSEVSKSFRGEKPGKTRNPQVMPFNDRT